MADKYVRWVDRDGAEFLIRVYDMNDGTHGLVAMSPALPTGGTISGQIASVAGSATQGPNITVPNGVITRAHPDNSGAVVVGNVGGTVALTSGVAYNAKDVDIWQVKNLNQLWVIGAGTVCWHL